MLVPIPDRGVLVQRKIAPPGEHEDAVAVLWPVLVYRVTAPVQRVRRTDIFEKLLLALCAAGVRTLEELSAVSGLDQDLCQHILNSMRTAGMLGPDRAPTPRGAHVQRTDQFAMIPELVVTHVFQDAFTGELWPRSADNLRYRSFQGGNDGIVKVRLGRAGDREFIRALTIDAPASRPTPPRPEAVVAALAQERAVKRERQRERADEEAFTGFVPDDASVSEEERWSLLPDVHKIVGIGPPRADHLLCTVEPATVDVAADPFGLGSSPMLSRLLRFRTTVDSEVSRWYSELQAEESERLQADLRQASERWSAHVERGLYSELGEALHDHPKTVDLLLAVHTAAGQQHAATSREDVARNTFRMCEFVLRRMLETLPPPVDWCGRPVGGGWGSDAQLTRTAVNQAWEVVEDLSKSLGFTAIPKSRFKAQFRDNLTGSLVKILNDHMVWPLLPWCVIAAEDPRSPHRDQHPLRELARKRPSLLSDLADFLGDLRNKSSHSAVSAGAIGSVEWCAELATDLARASIKLPPETL
ncbi:hypothetical protein ACWEVP_02935 [Amycolatopsis sp. NPDC003865]